MSANFRVDDRDLPGLYQVADQASVKAQRAYLLGIGSYLSLLVLAAYISFSFDDSSNGALCSATLFLLTLLILVGLRLTRPDDIWYNGRAVAESVKTRAWRWMMCAEPYAKKDNDKSRSAKELIGDLKAILDQNRSLCGKLGVDAGVAAPVSAKMENIRALSVEDRLGIYKKERIDNQANWYAKKTILNRKRAKHCFIASIILHAGAILMLLIRIKSPNLHLPISVVATAASGILTWLQSKKYNELSSSYALANHEIVLIKGEALGVSGEKELSNFVVDSESAFSREHTQWVARKID